MISLDDACGLTLNEPKLQWSNAVQWLDMLKSMLVQVPVLLIAGEFVWHPGCIARLSWGFLSGAS